jgi:hypothetical protein
MNYSEFAGGLGDVFNGVFLTTRYTSLENIKPGELWTVGVLSHNPHVRELFEWHPKRPYFNLVVQPWFDDQGNVGKRAAYGLPPAPVWNEVRQFKVRFYPSPEDLAVLRRTKDPGDYVVVSSAAGVSDRDIPVDIRELAVDLTIASGLAVVLVGKNYKRSGRQEHVYKERPGLINLIDKLTVPGVAYVVAGAEGVLACFSSVLILSWGLLKKTLLLYPKHVKDGLIGPVSNPWTWGHFYEGKENNSHMQYSEWSTSRHTEWVKRIRG